MTQVNLSWDDAPTLEEMKYHRDELDSEWAMGSDAEPGLDKQQEDEEDLYFQKFAIDAPEDRWIVRTGSAPADCDSAIDTIVPTEISVTVPPLRVFDKYEDQADKLTRWAYGTLHSWRKRNDTIRDLVTDMVIRRYGVARVIFDDRLWPQLPPGEGDDWEAVNRRRNPVLLQRREPRHTRWREDDDHRIRVVVEDYETSVLEATDKYGQLPTAKRLLKGRKLHDKVRISDIWRDKYRCILLEDEPIFPVGSGKRKGVVPHLYPRVPYVVLPFRKLTFVDAARRFRGMLSNSKNLYEMESQTLTMHVWMMGWNAWRTYKGWTKDGRKIDIVPGQYIMIDQRIGEYLEMLEGKPVPPELLQTAQLFDSYIQRNGVSQGPRSVEGTRSGEQVWAIQAQRLVKIESAKQALTIGISDMLELAAMITELMVLKRGGKMVLPITEKDEEGEDQGQVVVRASDFNGYWDGFRADFGSRIDPAMLAQAQTLAQLAGGGWMPYEPSVQMSGLTRSPRDWSRQILRQKVDNLDFMAEFKALEEAGKRYGKNSQEYQMMAMRVAAGKGGGTSGGPGVPSPGAGQMTAMHDMSGDTAGNPSGGGMGSPQSNPQSGMV